MHVFRRLPAFLFFLTVFNLGAYEVTLVGGARMDIPEAWILDDSNPAIPAWYSPDGRSGADIMFWSSGYFADLQSFVDEVMPPGAEGDAMGFSWWNGEAAMADWTFEVSGRQFRSWFLLVRGTDGPDVRISGFAAVEDFDERQSFLLSVLDSYIPSGGFRLYPGAVSGFLEISGGEGTVAAGSTMDGIPIEWNESPAGNAAAQDVIEREAIVLSAYAGVPELFYPAWERYYRLIYRDGYHRLDNLAEALDAGPLPIDGTDPFVAAETILSWLQGFEYGSVAGFSDLLAPSSACSAEIGDCDSLSLVLLMLMDRYGVDGRLILTHQAHHAVTGLDLPGSGLSLNDDEGSWLVAELTTELPLGQLPDRLHGVTDWYPIDLFVD